MVDVVSWEVVSLRIEALFLLSEADVLMASDVGVGKGMELEGPGA
jgi:hypothetical protein